MSTVTVLGKAVPRPAAKGTAPVRAGQVPIGWLALLAAPVAAGANAPVLILPDMARSLGVATATATWLVTAFAWAMAAGTPLLAGLLRRRGLATVLRLSTALVLGGTALVAAAPWLPVALAGRAAQSLGGAGLVAIAMNLAGNARRMGVISSGFGILGAAGPLLGATLTDAVSWRLALAVSAVALVAVPVVARYAGQTPPAQGRFDARGATLLIALATALILLPTAPLPALAGALAAAVLLGAHVRRRPEGFVPARLLRSPLFVTSAVLGAALSTSYFTLLFTVPRLLQDRAGWTTGTIGTGQLVTLLIASAASWLLAAGSARMGRAAVRTVLIAVGVTAAVTAAFATSGALLLLAAGAAAFTATGANATLSVQAASAATDAQRPTAIGLFALSYQLGGAFGPGLATLLVLG
ncbi:Major Facilitator Superfamily protein [Streptomyces sp. YIM 121038]|uniref:MFS transporter n=1 Tax=Streptomyces sp. YIM 121038 TaxID=2136401 RepID=UPI0011106704|nr:MFS transporter [Streptomyces sp. YIM 121038]QCX78872.1 Major Facilitator Superfamily protein [Streptomyces sp. YIM 121038]